eukprot:gene44404-22601_t
MPANQKLREWLDEREDAFEDSAVRKAEARGGLNAVDKYGLMPLHIA